MNKLRFIIYEKQGNVVWITLNRAEARNAFCQPMREEFVRVCEAARDDDEVRVIVITGAGEKAFCAGADISEFPRMTPADQVAIRYGRVNSISFPREIPKPVIAMINGLTLGGGFELMLACDIAIASETAMFGQPEIRVGVIPGAGGTQVLPRLIGEKRAKELIYTGNLINATEALEMGIINRVVPPDKLRETTEEFVNILLKRSPVILKFAKAAVNRSLETGLAAGMASERDLFIMCFGTVDQKEGARAFLEKREPEYEGK